MIDLIREAGLDALIDTARLIPFLFITYLIMEYIERKTEDRSTHGLSRAGRLGPLFGSLVGVVPQCGFSAAAAGLFSGGVITTGTLLAVFWATSDEMLPIFLSEAVPLPVILKILGVKVLIALCSGFLIDGILFLLRGSKNEKHIHDLCEQDHCGCEEEHGIVRSALIHTLKITLFILVISFAITLLVDGLGEEAVSGFLTRQSVGGVLLAGLIGLIPNCASSVMITQLYLEGIMGAGQMMAGLLVSAGVGMLVLLRSNRHAAENARLIATLYVVGVVWGILIELTGITF